MCVFVQSSRIQDIIELSCESSKEVFSWGEDFLRTVVICETACEFVEMSTAGSDGDSLFPIKMKASLASRSSLRTRDVNLGQQAKSFA